MYSVYILENLGDQGWYIGYTANLERRVREHLEGRGGRTTKMRSHWKLIYSESYLDAKDARGRERFLKSGAGRRFLEKQLAHYLAH